MFKINQRLLQLHSNFIHPIFLMFISQSKNFVFNSSLIMSKKNSHVDYYYN
jgi:hypothetical protein